MDNKLRVVPKAVRHHLSTPFYSILSLYLIGFYTASIYTAPKAPANGS